MTQYNGRFAWPEDLGRESYDIPLEHMVGFFLIMAVLAFIGWYSENRAKGMPTGQSLFNALICAIMFFLPTLTLLLCCTLPIPVTIILGLISYFAFRIKSKHEEQERKEHRENKQQNLSQRQLTSNILKETIPTEQPPLTAPQAVVEASPAKQTATQTPVKEESHKQSAPQTPLAQKPAVQYIQQPSLDKVAPPTSVESTLPEQTISDRPLRPQHTSRMRRPPRRDKHR